ncbi:hemerythrin domain-containing protein [Nonomuraea sp. K274]|uniref:Hemerythrin domain-containing protein n=2 Tax=Nonomuraea cypriaca TaxID=1187855 RepID=A0A931ABZ4_9ACTN|nr:hemerythrin domain-containing protein [Nonomuraea cypriaca]
MAVEDDGRCAEQPPAMRRRELLGVPAALAGGLVVAGCASAPGMDAVLGAGTAVSPPAGTPGAEDEVPVTPPEDLMREHGVLKRILLIYREGIRRLEVGEAAPYQELNAGARIIRSFIEEYHERLEERYVFPRLVKAGKLTDVVPVLVLQHQRGRLVTSRIIDATGRAAPRESPPVTPRPTRSPRQGLVADMNAFIRMYEPHEAREDTVVFPALRDVVPPKEFLDMAEIFEDEEHRRFGAAGFTGVVNQVADIEKRLGIYNLAQFTPRG